MVLNYYFTPFLPFLWPINYNHITWGIKFFHTFITKLILIEDFFISLNSWCCACLCFMGLKLHKWMKKPLENCPYIWHWPNTFVIKFSNHKWCAFILRSNSLELGIIKFLWIPIPWWVCYRLTLFLVINIKLFVKVLWNWKHFNVYMFFNFWRWTLSLVVWFDSSINF
jgi:hypothetical protein